MADERVFVKKYVASVGGQLLRFKPGDTIPADVAAEAKLGDHLFAPDAPAHVDEPADGDLSKMTVVQLRGFAQDNDIDLGDASKKPEILDVITAWQAAQAEQSGGQ